MKFQESGIILLGADTDLVAVAAKRGTAGNNHLGQFHRVALEAASINERGIDCVTSRYGQQVVVCPGAYGMLTYLILMTGESVTPPGAGKPVHPLLSVLSPFHDEGLGSLGANCLNGADIDAEFALAAGVVFIAHHGVRNQFCLSDDRGKMNGAAELRVDKKRT